MHGSVKQVIDKNSYVGFTIRHQDCSLAQDYGEDSQYQNLSKTDKLWQT